MSLINIDEDFLANDRKKKPGVYAAKDAIERGCAAQIAERKARRPVTWIHGGREYARCAGCHQIVWLNKPFLGSMHFCG